MPGRAARGAQEVTMPMPMAGAKRAAAALVALAAWGGATGTGAHATRYALSGKIAIEGSSNVHGWTCATSTFDAAVEGPDVGSAEVGKALTSMVVTVPVSSIDCGQGSMNGNLRKAMHADRYPDVRYRMTSYDGELRGDGFAAVVHGVLTINGTDRPTDLKATVTPDGAGGAGVVGSASIDTRDFGVKPVSALLGTMRTSPKVTITFRLAAARG
jgi:polyisoprenoid-binding protein YceI